LLARKRFRQYPRGNVKAGFARRPRINFQPYQKGETIGIP
jgi:hypothetical protein